MANVIKHLLWIPANREILLVKFIILYKAIQKLTIILWKWNERKTQKCDVFYKTEKKRYMNENALARSNDCIIITVNHIQQHTYIWYLKTSNTLDRLICSPFVHPQADESRNELNNNADLPNTFLRLIKSNCSLNHKQCSSMHKKTWFFFFFVAQLTDNDGR